MAKLKFIISGGGTGGHIFPAIAIANALKKMRPDAEFLFVGAEGRMEMEKVPAAGYKIIGLPIMGLQRRLTLKNLKFPFKLLASLRKAKKIVKDFKPDAAIGVGGYASGPLLKMATKKGIPSLVQEQNSYAGVTNRLLAKRVQRVCVAYDGMEKFFPKEKIILTGNPVRQEVVKLEGKRERAFEYFGLDPNKRTILVIGGSLGAWSINEAVERSLGEWEALGVQLIWQTGKLFDQRGQEAAKPHASWVHPTAFITKMDFAYAAADLVVSRAGAIAVSELCLVKKPAILVPLPSAAEDHQTKNAMALVNHHAAQIIKDQEVREQLAVEVKKLVQDDAQLERLASNIAPLGKQDAADVIAAEVLKIAEEK